MNINARISKLEQGERDRLDKEADRLFALLTPAQKEAQHANFIEQDHLDNPWFQRWQEIKRRRESDRGFDYEGERVRFIKEYRQSQTIEFKQAYVACLREILSQSVN